MATKTEYCMWELFSDVMLSHMMRHQQKSFLIVQVFPQFLSSSYTHKQRTAFIFAVPKVSEYSVNKLGYTWRQVGQK